MRTSAYCTNSNNDVTIVVTIDAGRATRAQSAAGRKQTAALT